jgi:hypothetical protein
MSASFDKLMAMLKEKGSITDDEVKKVTDESGALTDQEQLDLSAERLKSQKRTAVTLEEYLAASKILDTAAEGSPEFIAAEKIVNEYEKAG